nr:hypothetical protein [uncultured Megasphaera sp.]
MLILQQMIIFVLLMAVGALARRYEILTPANQPQITKLVVNIAYPALPARGPASKGQSWHMLLVSPGHAGPPHGLCLDSAADPPLSQEALRHRQCHGHLHQYRLHGRSHDRRHLREGRPHLYDRPLDSF